MAKKVAAKKTVEALKHDEAKRKNIPSAEHQSILEEHQQNPIKLRYPRDTDLDPQLVWRGKDEQDWSDLVVQAPPLYIQEKVHPKALVDGLLRSTRERAHEAGDTTPDLFADFNGIPKGADKTEFYKHDQNWSNRMILGDSLQVMASLAEREGLRGKVQSIYFDPPYGIKFNSNFQWSTTSRDVKDGKADHITREPEQVKAFRDTWRDGIHSYPWEKWTVFLHPAQEQLVRMAFNGPARVSGSAGTGKTIVALHRAAWLARGNPNARVLLATFSDPLANALQTRLRRLLGDEPRLGERIDVHSLDAIGLRLYKAHIGEPKLASREDVRAVIKAASDAVLGHKFGAHFLLTEWEQVVDAWQLDSWEPVPDVEDHGGLRSHSP